MTSNIYSSWLSLSLNWFVREFLLIDNNLRVSSCIFN